MRFFQECSRFVCLTRGASSLVLQLKQLLRVCFAFSFDASFPAFWDAERARSSRRPASRIFFPELAVSQPGKSAHQKTYPGKPFSSHSAAFGKGRLFSGMSSSCSSVFPTAHDFLVHD